MRSYKELAPSLTGFFLEDLAVGLLRPIFNVDSER
jgi:hypothetical protein